MFLLRLSRQTDFAVFWKYLKRITRWTFFRVKLIFEYDFQISWSFGPWVPWNLGLLDFRTFEPLPSSTTSSYFLLPPPISSYTLLPLLLLSLPTSTWFDWVWFGLVWFGMGGSDDYWVHVWRDFNIIPLRKVSWVVVVGDIAIIASSYRSRSLRNLK